MKLDSISNQIYIVAFNEAKLQSHEFVTPEHFLYAAVMFDAGRRILEESDGSVKDMSKDLQEFFDVHMTKLPTEDDTPVESFGLIKLFELAAGQAVSSERNEVRLGDLLAAVFNLPESHAAYILSKNGVNKLKLLRYISHFADKRHEKLSEKKSAEAEKKRIIDDAETLAAYTVNLTQKAKDGALDPLIGREDILDKTIQALCRRVKNNPVHVGDAGVGKTAIIEGLARLVAEGRVPARLTGANILSLELGSVVAGTKYRGDFEERFIRILEACATLDNPVIYIDEIHQIIGAGSAGSGSMDASGILKPYLQKGNIRFIGAATYDDYKKYFEKDAALARRFQSIEVNEPSLDEAKKILLGVKSRYEEFHNVKFPDDAVNYICELSARYMNDRRLPDKAIDVLDETGARLRINNAGTDVVTASRRDIERTVSQMARIPENSVTEKEADTLMELDSQIKEKIFGQDAAVDAVVSAVRVSRAGLSSPDKPTASLLFVGPTGVGKTEIARLLAKCLNISLIRFDMSEYQESHSVSRLIGSPPGYVGYENGGLLTDAIRKTPHAVLLLDEIEKAHHDILNVLLQVMDYGVLTDNSGKKADFRNIVLIMTSNAGSGEFGKRYIGFEERERGESELEYEVKRVFSPEFRNRLDEVISFNYINKDMALKIALKAINELNERLNSKGISLSLTDEAAEWIAERGLSREYGGREIMRIINKDIVKKAAPAVLFKTPDSNSRRITVSLKNGELLIDDFDAAQAEG